MKRNILLCSHATSSPPHGEYLDSFEANFEYRPRAWNNIISVMRERSSPPLLSRSALPSIASFRPFWALKVTHTRPLRCTHALVSAFAENNPHSSLGRSIIFKCSVALEANICKLMIRAALLRIVQNNTNFPLNENAISTIKRSNFPNKHDPSRYDGIFGRSEYFKY